MSVLWTPLRLVMEEQERKEEAERWKDRSERGNVELGTLPSKHPLVQHPTRITTRAIMEGARHISSNETPVLNGLSSGGDVRHRHIGDQIEPDEKPPKLVVNLNQSDKASQIPEPLPTPEPEIEVKKDETDGLQEQDNSCLVDCLYLTLQCCDCSIM